MLNLLRKDFIALKSSQWTVLLYLVVFSVTFIPSMELSFHYVGIYTAFGSVMLATMIDIKNRNHNFLVTLPINRKQIVRAKYMMAILYSLFGILASLVIHVAVARLAPEYSLNKPDYTMLGILIPLGILLVLISIYMPLFYSLSKKGAGVINVVFMIAMILLAQPAAYLLNLANERNLVGSPLVLVIAISILALFIASFYVTVYLFKRKDL